MRFQTAKRQGYTIVLRFRHPRGEDVEGDEDDQRQLGTVSQKAESEKPIERTGNRQLINQESDGAGNNSGDEEDQLVQRIPRPVHVWEA